jgi:hypothetical protein
VLTLTGLMALMATLWRILEYILIENAISVIEMKEDVAISVKKSQ